MVTTMPEVITVYRLPIRLGQFLKLIEIADDGGEATMLITSGQVEVNAVTERRRGRKLVAEDRIRIMGKVWSIALPETEEKDR
jgi:ribosome-associated protein